MRIAQDNDNVIIITDDFNGIAEKEQSNQSDEKHGLGSRNNRCERSVSFREKSNSLVAPTPRLEC